ncbi:MAG: peptide/nickel transport system ATP-binding protein [Gaiellales bacterium]|nr:peptide/nickel transport system ATP-binding protein [Gaiellales bacterium]
MSSAGAQAARATGEGAASLEIDDLSVTFPTPSGPLAAVDSVSLSVRPGETLGLVGESGCGKTTLARCVAGLQLPGSGSIRLDGRALSPRRSRAEHRAIQIVFQDPFSSLNPRLSVRRVLTQLLAVHGLAHGAAAEARCRELMGLVGLPAGALDGYPSAFSGGQRQRIAIARALAVEPRILVADEPTSALDVSIQATILGLFDDLRTQLSISILMISHNLAAVRHLCERVAVMYLGRIVEVAPRDELFSDPRHPYTYALLRAAPRLRVVPGTARPRLIGEPPSATARPSGCAFHPRCPRAEERCSADRPELVEIEGRPGLAACHFRNERRTG